MSLKNVSLSDVKLPKINISKRSISILCIVVGLLLFYWLHNTKIPELEARRDKVINENIPLAQTEKNLTELYNNMSFYLDETVRLNKETQEMFDQFPPYMNLEDKILYADHLLKTDFQNYNFSELTYGSSEVVPLTVGEGEDASDPQPTQNTEGEEDEASVPMELYSVVFNASFSDLKYNQIKSILDYGLKSPQRFVLNNITVSFNEKSGYLGGDISFKTFFVPGQPKQYKFGTDSAGNNIIGSYNGGNRQGNLFGSRE